MEEQTQKRKTRGRKAKVEEQAQKPKEKVFYLRSNTGMHQRYGTVIVGVDEYTEIRENDLNSSFFLRKIEKDIENGYLENLSE